MTAQKDVIHQQTSRVGLSWRKGSRLGGSEYSVMVAEDAGRARRSSGEDATSEVAVLKSRRRGSLRYGAQPQSCYGCWHAQVVKPRIGGSVAGGHEGADLGGMRRRRKLARRIGGLGLG